SGLRETAPPVHARAAAGVPVDPRREGASDRDPRIAAEPALPAGRLPVLAALPARDRRMPGRRPRPARRGRRPRALHPVRGRRRAGTGGGRGGALVVSEPLLRTEGLPR